MTSMSCFSEGTRGMEGGLRDTMEERCADTQALVEEWR